MIDPGFRFWAANGALDPCSATWDIIDWDQRRWFFVKGSLNVLPEADGELEVIRILAAHACDIGQGVYGIEINDHGEIFNEVKDTDADVTPVVDYPRYLEEEGDTVLRREQLVEQARLGPCVDYVCQTVDLGKRQQVVFKYFMTRQHATKLWDDLHITKSLKGRPSIIPFDSVVLDDIEPRVLGFTTQYIPGGSLDSNRSPVFRFSWLQELTSVVDDPNLHFGIAHQDTALRNLLIHPTADSVILFDFDRAVKIGDIGGPNNGYTEERNDVDVLSSHFTKSSQRMIASEESIIETSV